MLLDCDRLNWGNIVTNFIASHKSNRNYYFCFNIKHKQVIELFSKLFEELDYPKNVVIRSDNGSQFINKDIRKYLSLVSVSQELKHVATLEENAHIEAYHDTLKREVLLSLNTLLLDK